MDVLGVNCKKSKGQAKRCKKAVKVVYISSPMKVQTSVSKFRALVQELTGKDSDTTRFMDVNGGDNSSSDSVLDRRAADDEKDSMVRLTNSYNESFSPSSDSVFESFDRFLPPMEGSFMSLFQSNPYYEYSSHGLDMFN